MRILIVDDERPARDKLRRMLASEPGITAIEEARDGVEALERLPAFAPDVLLLDIQMPEITGLDVAASLPSPAPLVVFVTAYDEYAIRAFDANAIDYLLKPYDQPRLQRALQRVRERLAQQSAAAAQATPAPAAAPLPAITQLLVPERSGTRVVKVDQIQWIETADNYVILHTADGAPLMRQTLAGLLDKLGPRFLRCHRRAAVQVSHIASIANLDKGDGEIILHTGARVPLSRQYRTDLEARLVSECKR
ncbi:two component transcriptional regulator, LytTR family [Duganella sp. CF402]|uniref:LytR/AlgR family response regulator transcription factor n=1 Tax=unclassified Duganella TaxID=2636909 RepID=UPI0008B15494|nr:MULTISPECIES: response regulator [unclassified Duganella]RZT09887.1 LytTR family two component transcriptional regulator [Duganella sp. BK701]SEL38481.1 two component transcriptional regulator, LytTR family [Duganella sp. CF402]